MKAVIVVAEKDKEIEKLKADNEIAEENLKAAKALAEKDKEISNVKFKAANEIAEEKLKAAKALAGKDKEISDVTLNAALAGKDKVISDVKLNAALAENDALIGELKHRITLGLMSSGAMNMRSLLESMITNAYNDILVERNDSTKAFRRISMTERCIEVAKRGKSVVCLFVVLAECLR